MADDQRLQRMESIYRRQGWWSKETVAVVTAGSKGVGYEMVRQLGKHGITVVLAARDEDAGQSAADSLKAKGLAVVFHRLDPTDDESVEAFAAWIKRCMGGLNILINNAGVKIQEVNFENAREVIATNYVALRTLITTLLPLFRPSSAGGRIVNMSSGLGKIKHLNSEAVRRALSDEENLNEDLINNLAAHFLTDVTNCKLGTPNWPWCTYHVQYAESKAFVNAYTRVLAKSLTSNEFDERQIFVNAAAAPAVSRAQSVGKTHGKLLAPLAPLAEECADTPVWLALLPREGYPSGRFFFRRQETEF